MRGVSHIGCCAGVLLTAAGFVAPVLADHVPHTNEVLILRPNLDAVEGYLNFVSGAEYTGHTNKNETARDGGQDFADNWITIKNILVTDSNGVTADASGLSNDLEYARKVYAQAGIAVRSEGTGGANASTFPGIGDFPFSGAEIQALRNDGSGRSPNADTINVYYVESFDGSNPNGITTAPRLATVTMAPGVFLRTGRANSTHPHELGHMLFNGPVIHDEIPGNTSHSNDNTNFMYVDSSNAPSALTDVGPKIGSIGNHSIITKDQISTIHGNPGNANPGYVKHSNNIGTHGDRADFDWVADQRIIETGGGGNGADIEVGPDWLIWEINEGAVSSSGHSGPGSDGHDHSGGELVRGAYAGSRFNVVDIFSNVNQYADNDTVGSGLVGNTAIRRVKALDYFTPQFSADGTSWRDGSLVNVFQPGWTNGALQDDFVSRYSTDVENAKFVRISAATLDDAGHDGNAQIDAVMAGFNPDFLTYLPVDPSLGDGLIIGPGIDEIFVDLPGTKTEGVSFSVPDAQFNDPDNNFELVTLPVRVTADVLDEKILLQFDFTPTDEVPSLPEPGTSLRALFDIDLLSEGADLLPIEMPNDFDNMFFRTILSPDGDRMDSQFRIGNGEDLRFNTSFEAADGVVLDFSEPNPGLFGDPDADAEFFFGFHQEAPPASLLGSSSLVSGFAMEDVPLLTITLTAAVEVVPEPGTAAVLMMGVGVLGTAARRRVG